ncbi:DUF2642 domain-containing protein [Paenibacillus filicis]|uniref:DUF2642 domain-containing protein n=1 Tax=Paenibacillus gyeongsangnamensis TaxID=3388067 RepID=A0ABT4QCK8_9BACL|nr:DUF2642 domain-containing protein [Paenibacillus filicis]MCZ8514623.1 DUF2642 domain-containing protein [Paenibacillus filicis]
MKTIQAFLNQQVELTVSGKKDPLRGKLLELGSDILVIQDDLQFIYIPILHLQQISISKKPEAESEAAAAAVWEPKSDLSYRKVLMNAKGMFTELFITGNKSIHGYVASIMNDFFVFHSPLHHFLLVSMRHLKYLIPYEPNTTPYSMNPSAFPLYPNPISLARNMEQQLKKLEGEFVVLNLGENAETIGLLKTADSPLIEIVNSTGASSFMHIDHVKTVHRP